MKRSLIYLLIVIFWAVMMVSHFIKEGILFPPSIQPIDYRTIFKYRIPYHEEWMGIYLHGKKVGYTSSNISPYRGGGSSGLVLYNLTEISLPFKDKGLRIGIHGYSFIDQDWCISKMDYKITSDLYRMKIKGERRGDTLEIRLYIGEDRYIHTIPISKASSIFGPIYLLPAIRPKRVYTIGFLNPFTQKEITLNLTIEGKKRIMIDGREEEVYIVKVWRDGTLAHLLVRRNGELIRLDTPFGWTLLREEGVRVRG